MADAPKEIYCLKCKKHTVTDEMKKGMCCFKSKKNGTDMQRPAWQGKCSECHMRVSQFAKVSKEPEPVAQAPVEPAVPSS